MEVIRMADLESSNDTSAIINLLNEYAMDPMGGNSELNEFVKNNLIAELKKRKNAIIILAFQDSLPVGLAICFEGFSTFACKPLLNIHDLVVSLSYRGKGISKRLLAKVQEIAINLGCCKLTLEVLEGNEIAKSSYKSFGFEGYELDPKMGKAMILQKKL